MKYGGNTHIHTSLVPDYLCSGCSKSRTALTAILVSISPNESGGPA